jgi:hypothetical protein
MQLCILRGQGLAVSGDPRIAVNGHTLFSHFANNICIKTGLGMNVNIFMQYLKVLNRPPPQDVAEPTHQRLLWMRKGVVDMAICG